MPGAGSTSRRTRDVFARLNNEPKNVFTTSEEDLQYPQSLGGDEYNQFVLFTMYESASAEMKEISKKVRFGQQQLSLEKAAAAEEFASSGIIQGLFGKGVASAVAAGTIGGLKAGENFIEGTLEYLTELSVDSGFLETVTGGVSAITNFIGFTNSDTSAQKAAIAFLKTEEGKDAIRRDAQALFNPEGDTTYNNNVADYGVARANKDQTKQFVSPDESFRKDRSQSTIDYADSLGLGIKDREASVAYNRIKMGAATQKAPTNIALYIPNKIVNNAGINYNGVDFGTLQALKGIATGDLQGAAPIFKRKLGAFADSVLSIVGTDLNSEAAMQAVTGLAINPRQQQLFNGVNTRTFDFSFSFAPRNQKEAKEVNKIVRAFRRYSHPEIAINGYMLDVPAEFEIRYYKVYNDSVTRENLFLNKIGRCVLETISVDYTPNAVMSTFPDGSPVRTTIVMSFKELRPLTREDIDEGY